MTGTYFIEKTSFGSNLVSMKSKLLQKRVVVLEGEIDGETAGEVVQQLLVLATESDKPITLLVDSPGGEIQAGMKVIDVMDSLPCTIKTVSLGMAASMAAVIVAAGTKGHRYISKSSRMMVHEPILGNGLGGTCSTVQATAKAILERKVLINELLAKLTAKDLKEIETATDHDNYMSANEAQAFGLTDHVAEDKELFDVLKGVECNVFGGR